MTQAFPTMVMASGRPDGSALARLGVLAIMAALTSLVLVSAVWGAGFSSTAPMTVARYAATATLLPSGKVLVAGGQGAAGYLASAEIYDPANNSWTAAGNLGTARGSATGVLLPSGQVLIAGGYSATGPVTTGELYDPASNSWSSAGTLVVARSFATATLLPNGQVLLAGGMGVAGDLASAELYDPVANAWNAIGAMGAARRAPIAALLPNGKVLVAGGSGSAGYLSSAELYDPSANSWTPVGAMNSARIYATGTVLPDGKVLLAGGEALGGPQSTAEVFDPLTNAWSAVAPMVTARESAIASLLPSGKVLVAGGFGFPGQELTSAELYDPATNTWSAAGVLVSARRIATATLLPSGKVLVAGGFAGVSPLASVESYDVASGSWGAAGSFANARQFHTSSLLPSGKILVAGGFGSSFNIFTSVQVYDPVSNSWSAAAPLLYARGYHTATLVSSGKLLLAGGPGSLTAEFYDPSGNTWTAAGTMAVERYQHTATLLSSGNVLVAGGQGASFTILGSAELFDPSSNSWSSAASLAKARRYHTATLLPSGKVLVTGGIDSVGADLASVEIYDPATNTWSDGPPLSATRYQHTATLLPSGKVLVAGGLTGNRASTELYDPATNTWAPGASMVNGRFLHTAVLLPSGNVLVAGGRGFSGTDAEVYDTSLNMWIAAGSLSAGRYNHASSLLATGRVVVSGGQNAAGTALLASAESFDVGLGFSDGRRPALAIVTDPVALGLPVQLDGTGFTGDSEASSGTTGNSPGNFPLVQFHRMDNGQLSWLSPDPARSFSDTTWQSANVTGLVPGPHAMTMFVNGIPSIADIVDVINVTLSTTAITGTPNPSVVGQTVTFTATVTGNGPTGSVEFRAGAGAIAGCGSVPLASGQATCATSGFAVGAYSIAADYSGDGSNAPSTSSALIQTVTAAITVPGAPTIGPAVAGTSQATISFTAPADDGGAVITGYTATSSPGNVTGSCAAPCASITVSGLTNGVTYSFTVAATNAVGTGPASSSSNLVTPSFATTTTVLAASPNPSACNQSVTFTATVTGASPTGTVSFNTGGMSSCATAALSGGSASCTASGAAFGSYTVVANYSGDADNAPSSGSVVQTVSQPNLPPTASAGGPYRINLDSGVSLNASGSSDPDAGCGDSIVAFGWDVNDDGNFGDAVGATPTLSASQLAALGLSTAGVYTIKAQVMDSFGASSIAVGSLTIQALPGAPTSVTATAGDGQATVTFAPPASDGFATITNYSATSSPGSAAGTCAAPCTSINVTGLVNGLAYTFTVTATNAAGVGPASAASNGVTPEAFVGYIIDTIAGGGAGDGGAATSASLSNPKGVAVDADGNLYIADQSNHRIRKVDAATGVISTVAGNGTQGFSGDGGAATDASLGNPVGVAVDAGGNLYIADVSNHRIRKVDAATGVISTVAGNGTFGYSGDGGAATSASLGYPVGVAVDADGNLYIADVSNHRIRKVDAATGVIGTVAGNGTYGYSGDGGAATSASLSNPYGVAVDADGNLYIADLGNHRIRKVDAATGVISTVAGNGTYGYSGDGGAATDASLGSPYGVAVDADGSLYIADLGNHRIRKVDAATGVISTVAGNGTYGYSGDGGAATGASLGSPYGVAVDADGNLYIADVSNRRIRKVDAATGVIGTVAGNGTYGFSGDGGVATSASLSNPYGVAVDAGRNTYIADSQNNRVRKVHLVGQQPPDAPSIGTATAGIAQATVTFAAPASDGGSVITSYTATSSPGSIDRSCAAPCTSITIPGLINGVSYTFSVTATNAVGTGPASAPSNAVTPTPAPKFTSASAATFTVKSPNSFTVTAEGAPAPTLSRSGALPSGVTFAAATGVVAGTPAGGTVGTYAITFTARNGVPPDATQTFTLTVVKADQTITFDPLPDLAFGSPTFTLVATASSALTVTFSSLTSAVCTVTGKTVKLVAAGTCSVAANQAGNANYNAAPQVVRTFAVGLTATTVTTIQASKEPSVVGQAYTVTVTVTSPTGVPKGSVTVSDGLGGTCTDLTLSAAGVASCAMTSTFAGTLTLTGVYSGSAGYGGSSGSTPHVVNQAATRTVVTSSADPALPGTLVTLNAKVAAVAPGKGIPGGTVEFTYAGSVLGTGTLDAGGNATYSTATLPVGNYAIVANYLGDANYAASVSATFTQNIVAFPVLQFSVASVAVDETAGSVSLTITHSGSALGPVTVTYASADGSAVAPGDYGAVSGVLSWAAGDGSNRTVVVPILVDAISEPIERFTVTLSVPAGATLGARPTVTVAIRAN